MKQFIDSLDKIWTIDIKEAFCNGLIPYERQLQAELYHRLKIEITEEYKIWVEPVMYLRDYELDKIKPDLVITKEDLILAVIELKFSPWSYVNTSHDLDKFKKLLNVFNNAECINISWIPFSENWEVQKTNDAKKLYFQFSKNTKMILCAIAKQDSNGLKKSSYSDLPNFRLYKGFIGNGRNDFDFE